MKVSSEDIARFVRAQERLAEYQSKVSESQKQAIKRYKAKHIMRISMELNRDTESDIIAWLEKQPQKRAAIKAAIRKQITAEAEE